MHEYDTNVIDKVFKLKNNRFFSNLTTWNT